MSRKQLVVFAAGMVGKRKRPAKKNPRFRGFSVEQSDHK
jgi:hypothetical protein